MESTRNLAIFFFCVCGNRKMERCAVYTVHLVYCLLQIFQYITNYEFQRREKNKPIEENSKILPSFLRDRRDLWSLWSFRMRSRWIRRLMENGTHVRLQRYYDKYRASADILTIESILLIYVFEFPQNGKATRAYVTESRGTRPCNWFPTYHGKRGEAPSPFRGNFVR